MEKQQLKKLIDVAAGRQNADLVIKNCKVVDVYNQQIIEGDIAISDSFIAGIGAYRGDTEIDAQGMYASPAFIDSHIHIESSYVSPEEIGRLLVPCGTSTIIADPHEIVNVAGLTGLSYMLDASKGTALDIKMMLPSCVPATPWEHAGAVIDAKAMKEPIADERITGLGEFMNYPGVVFADNGVLDKLMAAKEANKPIDGHSPSLSGKELNAYTAARITTDHECSSAEALTDRISRGMYVLLRQGSACHDLRNLLKGVTEKNSRRCLLCSDDRQPKTIFELGHLDHHLRICVEEGISPIVAIQMASLNAAECFRLYDRGAIAPGLRADIVLLEDLTNFNVRQVFLNGQQVAKDKKYLLKVERKSIEAVAGCFHVKDFCIDKLKMHLKSNHVNVIGLNRGSVVTSKETAYVKLDAQGDFVYEPDKDIVKMAVVERHQNTGNVALGFLKGYGIKEGAIALSIAHDSHNIIAVGVNNEEMAAAVEALIAQNGGVVMVKDKKVIDSMPMPIGGIMSDQSGEWVDERLTSLHESAHNILKISSTVEPVMTLCFMSLAVIPEIKLTDMGLFDVTVFDFIPIEVTYKPQE